MEEIKELDDKYLVLKWKDIIEGLSGEHTKHFVDWVQKIDAYRRLVKEKPVNRYVVLNMDDEIDLNHLRRTINKKQSFLPISACKVEDIAVDLINAILITKG